MSDNYRRIPEEQFKQRKADNRGRVRIGKEYADQKVAICVMEVVEDSESDRIECPICGKKFSDPEEFKEHVNEEL